MHFSYIKSNVLCKWSNILRKCYIIMFTPVNSLLQRSIQLCQSPRSTSSMTSPHRTHAGRQRGRQPGRQPGRHEGRQARMHAGRHAGRHAGTQADRQRLRSKLCLSPCGQPRNDIQIVRTISVRPSTPAPLIRIRLRLALRAS